MEAKVRIEQPTLDNQIEEIPIRVMVAKGDPGDDGYSPTVVTSKSGKITTITINDKNGAHTATIDDGDDGFSPTVDISKTGKITTITITDVNGTHTATIRDGEEGSGTGDMVKAIYDTDDNGIVDNAEKVNNHTVEDDVPAGFFSGDATVTGTGSELTLNGTMNTKLSDAQLLGDTFQQTYSGKNLLPILDGTTSISGITATIENGILTLNGTATAAATIKLTNTLDSIAGNTPPSNWLSETMPVNNLNGKTISFSYISGTPTTSSCAFRLYTDTTTIFFSRYPSTTNNTYTWTADSAQPSCFCFFFNSGVTFTNYKVAVQIESGSATTFEKYVGGTSSPNPQFPQDIDVVTGEQTVTVSGKNLFDGQIRQGNQNGSSGVPKRVFSAGDGIYIKTGETYTFSTDLNLTTFDYALYLAEKPFLSANNTMIYNSNYRQTSSFTYTATADGYFGFTVRYRDESNITPSDISSYHFMIERNSQPTTYEPYQSQSYTIDLGSIELAKIGTYQDYIYKSGDDWYVHKETGKYTFTGSEAFSKSGYSTTAAWVMYWVTTSLGIDVSVDSGYCEFGEVRSLNNISYVNNGVVFNNNTGSTFVKLLKSMITNWDESATDSAKVELAKNMITGKSFNYVLATPTDTKITNTDLISDLEVLKNALSYDGQTNFKVTATNLAAILKVAAYRKTLNGIIQALNAVL